MPQPIQPVFVGVDLGGGVDTFTDAKLVLPGSLLEAQNVRYNRDGVIQRSNGRLPLGTLTSPGSVDKLLVRGEQLAAYTKDGTLSRYDAQGDKWVSGKSGYLPVPWATSKPIGPSNNVLGSGLFFGYSLDVASNAASNGTEIATAYCPDGGDVTVDICDSLTGTVKQTFSIAGPASDVKIAYNQANTDYLVAINFATSGGTAGPIRIYKIRVGTSGSTLVWTSPSNALGSNRGFDFCAQPNDGVFPVLYCAASNVITLGQLSWNGAAYVSITAVTTTASGTPDSVCIARPSPQIGQGFKCFIAGSGVSGTKGFFSDGLTVTTALFNVSSNTEGVTACQDNAGNCYVSQKTASQANQTSRYKVTAAAAVSALDSFYAGIPCSQLQLDRTAQDVCYQWMTYVESLLVQPCYFLARLSLSAGNNDYQPIGRVLYGKAKNFVALNSNLPSIVDFTARSGAEKMMTTVLQTAPFITTSVYDNLRTSLNMVSFGLDPASGWQTAEAGKTLYVSGGYLAKFDGNSVTENGFLLAPTKPTVSAAAGTGVLAAGTYLVAVVFEEIDAQGRVHRSAVSPISSIALSGGSGSSQITTQVPSYAATGPAKQMRIAFYRSEKDKAVLYREGVGAMTPTGGTISVTLGNSTTDAALAAREQIYTSGGQWDNYQPSAPIAIAFDKNRASAIEGDNLGRAIFSKRMIPGNALSFFPVYYRSAEVGGDEMTGVASALSRKFAFKKRGIFVASGDGADDTLAADTLSQFEDQSKDIGAIDPRSVVVTQEGIVFRSIKGIYLLGLDGGLTYVGADVFAYSNVDSFKYQFATFNKDTNEVYFVSQTATPAVLVLKLFRNKKGLQYKWTTGTLNGQANVKDVAVWGGAAGVAQQRLVYALNSTSGGSLVGVDAIGAYSDALVAPVAHVQQRIVTNWVKLNGIMGFGRLWTIYVLGASYSSHQFNVDIAYDYESTWFETKSISSVNATIGNTPYMFAVQPTRTMATAFRLAIYDSAFTNAAKDTFELSGLLLELGIYGGAARLRAEKSV